MGRPLYETKEDLNREEAVADELAKHFNSTYEKLPDHFTADIILTKPNGKQAVVEIKCRNVKARKYRTYIIAKQKYDRMMELKEKYGTAILCVRWTDAIGYVKLPQEHKLVMGGRYDRNDPKDWEPMVEFPISRFTIIRGNI